MKRILKVQPIIAFGASFNLNIQEIGDSKNQKCNEIEVLFFLSQISIDDPVLEISFATFR